MKKKVALLLAGMLCVGCASACGGGSSGKLSTSKWQAAFDNVSHEYWSQTAIHEEWVDGERWQKSCVEGIYCGNMMKATITDYAIDENGEEVVDVDTEYYVYEDGIRYSYGYRGQEEINGEKVDVYGWEAKVEESDFQETFDQAISALEMVQMMADFYNYSNGYYFYEMNQGGVVSRTEIEFDGTRLNRLTNYMEATETFETNQKVTKSDTTMQFYEYLEPFALPEYDKLLELKEQYAGDVE